MLQLEQPFRIRFHLYVVSSACLLANTLQLFQPMPGIWSHHCCQWAVMISILSLHTAIFLDVSCCVVPSSSRSGIGIVLARTVVLLHRVPWYTALTDPNAMSPSSRTKASHHLFLAEVYRTILHGVSSQISIKTDCHPGATLGCTGDPSDQCTTELRTNSA
jgi:hypothetical protein